MSLPVLSGDTSGHSGAGVLAASGSRGMAGSGLSGFDGSTGWAGGGKLPNLNF